ncbi:pili assembly chaperone [Escherichia coli]|nr:pili assembly chaperone [Escherichia coli]
MFNLTNTAKIVVPALALLATAVSFSSHASVTPDRTRLVFNEATSPSASRCATTIPHCLIWRRAG